MQRIRNAIFAKAYLTTARSRAWPRTPTRTSATLIAVGMLRAAPASQDWVAGIDDGERYMTGISPPRSVGRRPKMSALAERNERRDYLAQRSLLG